MVAGKRVHRILPEGATASNAKLVEAELLASVTRAPKQKQVPTPGDPPRLQILEIYMQHSETLRSTDTSRHHAMRLRPWAEKYRASQAQEFADHVIRDMSKLIDDPKTGAKEPAYAAAIVNCSLACAERGLPLAWKRRLTHESHACASRLGRSTTSARCF